MAEKLLARKELAEALRRSRPYIGQMEKRGFKMSGGRATLTEAREWLRRNPKPFGK